MLARDQTAVRQFAQTDRQVEALGHEIHVPVRDVQLHANVRVFPREPPKQRRQTIVPVRRGYAQPDMAGQGTAVPLNGPLGVIDQQERRARLFQIEPAVLRQAQPPRGATQQLRAQPGFQACDGPAQHGRRAAQCHRAGSHRAFFDHRHECFHVTEMVEFARHLVLQRTKALLFRQFISANEPNKVRAS